MNVSKVAESSGKDIRAMTGEEIDFDMNRLKQMAKPMYSYPYKVRPLEAYEKGKELRRNAVKKLWNAREEGAISILGLMDQMPSICVGLNGGKVSHFTFGPYYGKIMDDSELNIECLRATEAKGWGPDTCATLRVQLGSIFMGFHNKPRDGKRPGIIPAFTMETHICEAQSKIAREMSNYYGIPYVCVEMPPFSDASAQEFHVASMADAIEKMQKITGKGYDDEKLIEAVYNEWESRVWWTRACKLMQAIPAPIDLRTLTTIGIAVQVNKVCHPEVTQFLKEFHDEVEMRVRDGLGVLLEPEEKARLCHEGVFPFFHREMGRSAAPWGGIFVMSRLWASAYGVWDTWKLEEEGTWEIPLSLKERGIQLRNREEALRSLAELYTRYAPGTQYFRLGNRPKDQESLMREWKLDGAVFMYDRTCHGITANQVECKRAVQEMGYPAMSWEYSMSDPRENGHNKLMNQLQTFSEDTMGLKRLL